MGYGKEETTLATVGSLYICISEQRCVPPSFVGQQVLGERAS